MTVSSQAQSMMRLARGGSYSLSRDVLKHRIYDARLFGTTAADATLFVNPIGATWGAATKTLSETNMYDTGKLPNGQVMIFTRMGIQCITFASVTGNITHQLGQAFIDLLHSSVFEIKIQGREWDQQIHGSEFLPTLAFIGDTGGTSTVFRAGDTISSGWVNLAPTPIVLDQLVSFSVIHRLGNPIAAVTTILDAAATALNGANSVMLVTLEGLLTRAK